MSEWATASAWIRCAPSLTNISPTTDLPLAMPPVRPSFSTRCSRYVRIGIVLFAAPQEIDQSNYSDNQRAHAVQPAGSPGKNDWPKENEYTSGLRQFPSLSPRALPLVWSTKPFQ